MNETQRLFRARRPRRDVMEYIQGEKERERDSRSLVSL